MGTSVTDQPQRPGPSSGSAEPVRVTSAIITGSLMQSLGASPLMGRMLTPADDAEGVAQVAILSHGLWQRAFGGDRGVIGKEVQ